MPKWQGQIDGKAEKKFCLNLVATTSTLPGPLSPGPPEPGPGYDVPPEPPSRRPWAQGTGLGRWGRRWMTSSDMLEGSTICRPSERKRRNIINVSARLSPKFSSPGFAGASFNPWNNTFSLLLYESFITASIFSCFPCSRSSSTTSSKLSLSTFFSCSRLFWLIFNSKLSRRFW